MNDFVRDKLTNDKGEIAFYGEMIAGGCVSIAIFQPLFHIVPVGGDRMTDIFISSTGWWESGHVHKSLGNCEDSSSSGRRSCLRKTY